MDSFHVDKIMTAMYTAVAVFICQRNQTLALSSSFHLDVTHEIPIFQKQRGNFRQFSGSVLTLYCTLSGFMRAFLISQKVKNGDFVPLRARCSF